MSISAPPSRIGAAALPVFLLLSPCLAQSTSYRVLQRQVIESRLQKYARSNREREATLKQMLAESGCKDHLSEQRVKGSKLPNVICSLQGSSERDIIVAAHFDHVSEGDGVVDNWSGAALLPSLYETLKVAGRKHNYLFIGFTDEEPGEVGSAYYVKQMTKQQVANADAMVNMDSLGLAPTKVWVSHSDKQLVSLLVLLSRRLNMPITGANVEKIGSSDSEQFAERKIPRITIHSLTQETWNAGVLHTSKDKLSAIHLDEYYQTYQLLAAYLVVLDQLPARQEPGGKND